jgi:hypothetical protein
MERMKLYWKNKIQHKSLFVNVNAAFLQINQKILSNAEYL